MERKLISEADSRPLVVLDPRAPESPEALDAAVRAAASLVVHFAKRGGCGLLLPGDRRAHVIERDLLAWPQAHVRLALVEEHTGPALTAAQNRRGVIAYVAARTVDRVPRGLGRTPGGCLLVIPGALPNRRAVIEVAGCHGYVARAHRQRGADGDGRGGRRHERRRHSAPCAAPAPALRSAAPDERAPAARRCARPGRCCRSRSPAASTFLALATFGALHWMAMLEPTAAARAWYAVGTGRAGDGRAARAPPGCAGALRWLAVAAVTRRRARARLPRRRHPPTSCCGPTNWDALAAGHRARHRRAARRARALPRHRRVDAARDPARRHGADRARRARRVLAAARGAPASRSPR